MIKRKTHHRYVGIAGIIVSLLCLFVANSNATGLRLNGNWSAPFGDNDGPWNLGQSYNLSLGHDLTSAIKLNGNFRYSTNERQGEAKSETLSPSVTMSLTNDLFRINMSGTQNTRRTQGAPTNTTTSWNCNAASNLTSEQWPQLRLNYGESTSTNSESPATIDNDSKNLNTGLDYSWKFLKFIYNYRNSTNVDHIKATETQSDSHATNIQIAQNLWNNRVSFSGSHQFTDTSSTTSLTSSSTSDIVLDVVSSAALAAMDTTPATGTLPSVATLNDGNTLTATSVELPDIFNHLNAALQIDFNPTNQLRFYFDRQILIDTQTKLSWQFYTSIDGDNWNLITELPTIAYVEENGQTYAQIDFNTEIRTARYIKAVLTTALGYDTAFLAEISAHQRVVYTGLDDEFSTSNQSQQTQASISYRPWDNIQLGYSYNQNKSKPSNGTTSTQETHSVNSHLYWNRYFSLSLNASENSDKVAGLVESRRQSYSFSYLTSPLDAINFSINGSRYNQFEDSDKVQSSQSLSSNLTAVILPDLTANISYLWTETDDFITQITTTENYYTLNLVARLNSKLNISYFYSKQDTTTQRVAISYRPSNYISSTASAMFEDDTTSLSASLHVRVTQKIQSNLSYNITETDEETSHNASANFSWNMSQYISIRQNLKWNKSATDQSWSGLATVSYHY